jgi:regulatory protein
MANFPFMVRRAPAPRKQPDPASLQAAALAHLGRYAATEQGLARVLHRRIDRWAREAEGDRQEVAALAASARAEADAIAARLATSGAVDDAAFAQGRARSLARAGRSRRAIGAHLKDRGVDDALAAAALPEGEEHELAAALIHARKRRLGPFGKDEGAPETRRRALASLARAGFAHGVAAQALAMGREEAEARIVAFRSAL